MNVENMLRLADHLDVVPDANFRMEEWFSQKLPEGLYTTLFSADVEATAADMLKPECGTAACVAGHGMLLFGLDRPKDTARALGLGELEARALFTGPWRSGPEVARLLRALAAGQRPPAWLAVLGEAKG